jgi:hypothetical protein
MSAKTARLERVSDRRGLRAATTATANSPDPPENIQRLMGRIERCGQDAEPDQFPEVLRIGDETGSAVAGLGIQVRFAALQAGQELLVVGIAGVGENRSATLVSAGRGGQRAQQQAGQLGPRKIQQDMRAVAGERIVGDDHPFVDSHGSVAAAAGPGRRRSERQSALLVVLLFAQRVAFTASPLEQRCGSRRTPARWPGPRRPDPRRSAARRSCPQTGLRSRSTTRPSATRRAKRPRHDGRR